MNFLIISKLILQLVIFLLLLFSTQVSIISAKTIEPDKTSSFDQIKLIKDFNQKLNANEKAWLKENNSLKVAVKNGWMPIEFKSESEEYQGLSIDYLKSLSNILHVNFQLVDYVDNIKPAEANIISGVVNKNLSNSGFNSFTQPFLEIPLAIYTNKHIYRPFKIKSLDDVNIGSIAIFKGGLVGKKISEKYPKLKIYYVDIADEALELLRTGVVDAYVGNELVIDYHIAFYRLKFVEKSGLTQFTSTVSMAIRTDQPELASILEKGLLTIKPDNKKLIEKWIISEVNNNGIFAVTLSLLTIILILGLTKFYRLKSAISKNKAESQKQIWYQANFDQLTKLPNRHLLHNRLTQALDKATRTNLSIGIMYIDLDNFKHVNDQSGHSIGDKLLVEAAHRITKCVRSSDTTARIGGDEFMVIITDQNSSNSLENISLKILKSLERPFSIENQSYFISASIGITIYPDDSQNFEELLSYADQAMYEAKKNGRNRYQFFTKSIQANSLKRLGIANDLRNAIINDEFIIHYQPIINLKDSSITKAEALIRWIHPTKGMVSPLEFIPVAEETGLIEPIGEWVLHQTLKDLFTIRTYLNSNFQLSINVSPYQFRHSDSLISWINDINKQGIPGECFSLEITEGLLLDASNTVLETLTAVKVAGIDLAIDDFGTGYSALAYLKKFDVNYVKIDKSFIQNLTNDNDDSILCEAIINMAHKLNIQIIAEGIETVNQKDLLNQFTCDYGQGYLFAKPGTLDQLLSTLHSSRK